PRRAIERLRPRVRPRLDAAAPARNPSYAVANPADHAAEVEVAPGPLALVIDRALVLTLAAAGDFPGGRTSATTPCSSNSTPVTIVSLVAMMVRSRLVSRMAAGAVSGALTTLSLHAVRASFQRRTPTAAIYAPVVGR